jgi:hypothetical protein
VNFFSYLHAKGMLAMDSDAFVTLAKSNNTASLAFVRFLQKGGLQPTTDLRTLALRHGNPALVQHFVTHVLPSEVGFTHSFAWNVLVNLVMNDVLPVTSLTPFVTGPNRHGYIKVILNKLYQSRELSIVFMHPTTESTKRLKGWRPHLGHALGHVKSYLRLFSNKSARHFLQAFPSIV